MDLGYSAHKKSCGLFWTGAEAPFGEAIARTAKLLLRLLNPVLVLEAVLSTYHDARSGNPDIRGDFEQGRGWYHGPGVLTFAAALQFLQVLNESMQEQDLDVAEAFLSYKDTPIGHGDDAKLIYDDFWNTHAAVLREGVKPASPLVKGVPSVRVFKPSGADGI